MRQRLNHIRYTFAYGFLGILLLVTLFGCMKVRPSPTIINENYNHISIGNSKVYYTDNISAEDIDTLIDHFDKGNYFKTHIYMKLDKSELDEYFIYICVLDYVFTSETELAFYQNTANYISINVLYPNEVTIYLCKNGFEPIKAIKSKEYPKETEAD